MFKTDQKSQSPVTAQIPTQFAFTQTTQNKRFQQFYTMHQPLQIEAVYNYFFQISEPLNT